MLLLENDIKPLHASYFEIGRYYFNQKNYKEALKYFSESFNYFEHNDSSEPVISLYYALGRTYHELEKDKDSLLNYFLAFERDPEHNPQFIKEAQKILNETLVRQEYSFMLDWKQRLDALDIPTEARQELMIFFGRTLMLNNNQEDNDLLNRHLPMF